MHIAFTFLNDTPGQSISKKQIIYTYPTKSNIYKASESLSTICLSKTGTRLWQFQRKFNEASLICPYCEYSAFHSLSLRYHQFEQ